MCIRDREKCNQNILEYQKTLSEYQNHFKKKDIMEQYNQDIQKLKILQENQTMIYQYLDTKKSLEKNKTDLEKEKNNHEKIKLEFDKVKQEYQQLSQLKNQREQYIICLLYTSNTKFVAMSGYV